MKLQHSFWMSEKIGFPEIPSVPVDGMIVRVSFILLPFTHHRMHLWVGYKLTAHHNRLLLKQQQSYMALYNHTSAIFNALKYCIIYKTYRVDDHDDRDGDDDIVMIFLLMMTLPVNHRKTIIYYRQFLAEGSDSS